MGFSLSPWGPHPVFAIDSDHVVAYPVERLAGLPEGDDMRVVYLGVFLDRRSVQRLQSWWVEVRGPLHSEVYCHHMTMAYRPSEALCKVFRLKDHCSLKVTGYGSDASCQAVRVQSSCMGPIESPVPHITVATNDKSPSYSNELLQDHCVSVVGGPMLSGFTGYWNGEKVCHEWPVADVT